MSHIRRGHIGVRNGGSAEVLRVTLPRETMMSHRGRQNESIRDGPVQCYKTTSMTVYMWVSRRG